MKQNRTALFTFSSIAGALLLFFVFMTGFLNSPVFRRNHLRPPSQMALYPASGKSLKKTTLISLQQKGLEYLSQTSKLLPEFVGAKINCTNCHTNGGKTAFTAPWINVTKRYPKYRERTGKNVNLAGRINDCFERSLNGHALPENHPAMQAMMAYMESLEQSQEYQEFGIKKLVLKEEPNLTHGQEVYAAKCSQCHQPNGQGLIGEGGLVIYPPLWGKDAFNIAAGMARLHTAAGFAKHNMPLGQGESLSDQEAWDVAFYFSQQQRPDFASKYLDWPKGNKPKDARY